MTSLQSFTRTLDELMSRWSDVDDNRSSAPLEQPARALFGSSLAELAAIPGALLDLYRSEPFLADILRAHPSLTGEDPSRTLGMLFGEENVEWAGIQEPFAFTGMMTAATIVLAGANMPEQIADLAIRIGFGFDPYNVLLRKRLLGTFGGLRDPLKIGIELPPRLNSFDVLFNRTCLLGIKDALTNVAGASAALPRESATAVIMAIRPSLGCTGTVVEITGQGFGAAQPRDLDLCFTAYAGGFLVVTVPPADWSDTLIRATVPAGVGNGPVSLMRRGNPAYAGDTVTSATETLAGAMESCLGMGASPVAFALRQIATKLGAPMVSANGNNIFRGGPPKILSFTGNNAIQVPLRPRGPLVVVWNTENADSVDIITTGPPELPVIGGTLPSSGEIRYAFVNGTSNWQGAYTLIARNACGSVTAALSLEMRERLALALAGGGSKGSFEVGAVRCLTDMFNYRPDIITGTSVGALNAAKLAEGPAALPELEALWLAMVSTDDLYMPTGWVISIVQNLAALGIKGVGTVNFATLLGVKGGVYNWLSPDQQIAVGVGKNVLGNISGGSSWFTGFGLIFDAISAGLHLGKVVDGFRGLLRSQSLFKFDPIRTKIDAAIDPAKVLRSGIQLRIAIVSLDSGRTRYVDQRGRFVDDDFPVPLRDAVQASASIPIAYPPTVLDEGFAAPVVGPVAQPKGNYIDGGVRDNAPLRAADEAGASSIIAILPSPAAMDQVNFTGVALPGIAARGFETLFDEILQNDLAPFRGYNVPVKLIAPQIELYSMLTVDQGLIRINMDYGYMRAFDEMQADDALRAQFRQLSLDIAKKRLEVWGPLEHYCEGFLMEDEKVSFAAVGLMRTASTEYLSEVRVAKIALRALCLTRQNLARVAGANPPSIERIWQQWEGHSWSPTIVDPWQAPYAHVGPPVGVGTPPPPLPPV